MQATKSSNIYNHRVDEQMLKLIQIVNFKQTQPPFRIISIDASLHEIYN
jgi:hypothetical protein